MCGPDDECSSGLSDCFCCLKGYFCDDLSHWYYLPFFSKINDLRTVRNFSSGLFNKIIYKILISNELLICKTTKSLKKNKQKINLYYLISYVLVQKYYFSCTTNDINLSHCKESFFKWRLKVQH